MAKSGSGRWGVTPWNDLVFNWSVGNQSVANNTSFVRWELLLEARSSGRIDSSASKTWTIYVNGTRYTGTTTIGISNNSTKTLAVGSTTIKHNDDGTKTFTCNIYQDFYITFNGSKIDQIHFNVQGELDTIARASQPSCETWPEHTQNVGYFGSEISIHMNRKSSGFTHTVRYQFGAQSGTIATGVGTGTKWVIPNGLMDSIPNSVSGSGTIYVDTYNGSTKVGTKSCGFTATVPSNVKPSCTVAVSDPTGNATTYGNYVKGLSKLAVTVTPTTAYSSAIKSYSATANGGKYTTATFTTGLLNSSGTLTVSATVTDGRGRSGSATASVTVLDYTAPVVSKLTVGRSNADGSANNSGKYVHVTFSATVTALNNKNTATYKVRYKKATETSFTEQTVSVTNKYAPTNATYTFLADTGSSYDVEVYVADNHATSTRVITAPTAFTLMHFGADGTSIGLLKVAEKTNAVDVGGDIYMNGHAIFGAHGLVDNRSENKDPSWYMTTYGRGTVWEFKTMTAIGFTDPSATFAPVQTIIPWEDQSGGLPRQIAYEGNTRWIRSASSEETWGAWRYDALSAYPVGSIYIAYNHINPGTLFGGTWKRITGAFLWASYSDEDSIGRTGGSNTVTLTEANMPAHNHGGTYTNAGNAEKTHAWLASGGTSMAYTAVDVGQTKPFNIMPPYIQVSIWRREA